MDKVVSSWLAGGCRVQSEKILLERAKQNDQAALTQLYEENFDRIYRYVAFKTGNRTEAEDITQQVFLKALESIASYSWRGTPFSAWLYRIAHNQMVDYFRKRTKQATVPLDESLCSKGDDPTTLAERNCDIEQVTAATKKLTKAQQEVISLRFVSELPIAECARIMGKSEGAIKALQHSAIISLRKVLVE